MKKFNKITAISLTAVFALSSLAQAGTFTPADGSDGFSLGHYEGSVNTADRAKTEELYANRPMMLRQADKLSRGLVAVPSDTGALISWRLSGTESISTAFNLYRNGEKLNAFPIIGTNYSDFSATQGAVYTLKKVENGTETEETTATLWDKQYISIPVKQYAEGGYNIDDAATADLDGDGEFEFILRRRPADMAPSTRTHYPLIEAYDTDGTHMWTINEGPNEINEVGINILAYDLNGDGKSEVVLRSFEGTTDGAGNTIGDVNGDGRTDYSKDTSNQAIFTDRQYLVSTPEFLSVYDGATGAEIARTDLLPEKEPLSEWSYRYTDTGRLTKRASHFLFGLAYLDGVTPSIVLVRGAWDNVRAAAWHMDNGSLTVDWVHNTANKDDVNSVWGAMNHNMSCVDIDFDGKDEIISGPMALDHDGSEMYAVKSEDANGNLVKYAHGDAFDVAKMDPDYNGYLVWACHETSAIPGNIEAHDALSGEVLWGDSKNKDTGRSRAADITTSSKGYEVWGSTGTVPSDVYGNKIASSYNVFRYRLPNGEFEKDEAGAEIRTTLPMNFKLYWDGDLLSEFLDGTRISKYNDGDGDPFVDVILDATDCASNSGTKAVPCVCADLFGDWREEVVWKNKEETELRIYSTNIPTSYTLPTLMHDSYYRSQIATQSNHYNQPSNVSFYLGAETTQIPVPEIYVMDNGQKITNPDLDATHSTYAISKGDPYSQLELLIGSPNAYLDRDMVKIDANDPSVVPVIVNDRTLVPVRFIAESFGLSADYDSNTRVVTLKNDRYDISLAIGQTTYSVNGVSAELDVPAEIMSDRTMIPLRAMAEAIGKQVYYDSGYIYIGVQPFNGNDTAAIKSQLESGVAPETTPAPTAAPTPEPTATPDPLNAMEYTEEKDKDGTVWKIYYDEDYESYELGDAAGWAGTKPAPLDNIGVTASGGSKVMTIGGASKGNRNAIYRLDAPVYGKVKIEFDWNPGECTGGASYGELRLADSNNKVFLAFKSAMGTEMQYGNGGAISNGALETNWQNVGAGVTAKDGYHVSVIADFTAKTADFVITRGSSKYTKQITFTDPENFGAIEALAVRQEKNFDWTMSIDNLKVGME